MKPKDSTKTLEQGICRLSILGDTQLSIGLYTELPALYISALSRSLGPVPVFWDEHP